MILDDIHVGDDPSLLVLGHLAEQITDANCWSSPHSVMWKLRGSSSVCCLTCCGHPVSSRFAALTGRGGGSLDTADRWALHRGVAEAIQAQFLSCLELIFPLSDLRPGGTSRPATQWLTRGRALFVVSETRLVVGKEDLGNKITSGAHSGFGEYAP